MFLFPFLFFIFFSLILIKIYLYGILNSLFHDSAEGFKSRRLGIKFNNKRNVYWEESRKKNDFKTRPRCIFESSNLVPYATNKKKNPAFYPQPQRGWKSLRNPEFDVFPHYWFPNPSWQSTELHKPRACSTDLTILIRGPQWSVVESVKKWPVVRPPRLIALLSLLLDPPPSFISS